MGIIQASRRNYRLLVSSFSAIVCYSLGVDIALQALVMGLRFFIRSLFWWHFRVYDSYILPEKRAS